VRITFDPTKRANTFEERGLDFIDAEHVFAGPTYTVRDERFRYPEPKDASSPLDSSLAEW
jgi:uncharacterized DUF497 family protein